MTDIEIFDQFGNFVPPPPEFLQSCTPDVRGALERLRAANDILSACEAELAACDQQLRAAVSDRADAIHLMEMRFPKMSQHQLWVETFGRN